MPFVIVAIIHLFIQLSSFSKNIFFAVPVATAPSHSLPPPHSPWRPHYYQANSCIHSHLFINVICAGNFPKSIFFCIHCSLDANWIIFHVWLSEKHYFVYTTALYIIASMQSILMNCYHFCPQNKWKLVQFYGKIWGLQMDVFFFNFHFNNQLMKVIRIFNASICPKPKTNFILIAFAK